MNINTNGFLANYKVTIENQQWLETEHQRLEEALKIPNEKIDMAKAKYDGQAIQEIVRYFGLEDSYNDKDKSCSCPWHRDKTPSFIWNEKTKLFYRNNVPVQSYHFVHCKYVMEDFYNKV